MPAASTDRFADALFRSRTALVCIIVLAVSLIAAVVYNELLRPYLYLAGDSFTYFDMVRRFWDTGLLYSYSGIDHATGIHPGYYFLLLPFYPLLGLHLPQGALILNDVLVAAGLYMCYRAAGFTTAGVMLLVLLTPFGTGAVLNGMESSLLFLALSAIAWFLFSYDRDILTDTQALLLGFLTGIAVFARLDTIFLAAALYLMLVIRGIRSGYNLRALTGVVRELVLITITFFIPLGIAFFLNLHYDGTLLPLSGRLKSSLPHLSPDAFSTLLSLKTFLLALAVSGVYLIVRLARRLPAGTVVPALFLACAALYLYNGLFASGIGAWYGALPLFTLALALGLSVKEFFNAREVGAGGMLFVVCAALVFSIGLSWWQLSRSTADWMTATSAAAEYLDAQAPPGAAAGELKDGIFAFYARIPVYNLTGLGNNAAYVSALRAGTLGEYLSERHIRYIVGGLGSGIQVPGARNIIDCSKPFYDTTIVQIFEVEDCEFTAS